MAATALNKHRQKSARTREKIIEAAELLYGSRSIDAVSLSEITVASGQKNRNALQYHFDNREGLLQAIIDKHSARVGQFREDYFKRAANGEWAAAEAAARCLAMPIVEYIDDTPQGENFVRIVSQLTALNQLQGGPTSAMGIHFPAIPELRKLLEHAMRSLPPREAQRRIFLAVNITFHSIAEIYRAHNTDRAPKTLASKGPMVEQLICVLESFFAAAARS